MDFKYKIADVAKEFGMPAKKVVETVSGVTGEAYKTAGTFEEKELNVLLETLTRENAETSLDAYLTRRQSTKKAAPELTLTRLFLTLLLLLRREEQA